MNYKQHFENYISTITVDKSMTTIANYGNAVRMFFEYNGFDGEISTASLLKWRTHLSADKGCSITTINLYIQHMRFFCEYLAAIEKDFEMPNFQMIAPDKRKVSRERTKEYDHILSPDEVVEILCAERPKRCNSATWPRNKAILAMFLTGSMRNTELRSIRPCDLDWENGRIRLENTKGGVPRYAQFSVTARKFVREYLQSGFRPSVARDDEPLFVTYPMGKPDAYRGFERVAMSTLVERCVKSILGEEGIRTHALRHASASFMLSNNVPIDEIQKALGHSNINTTMIYAKRFQTDSESKKSVFDVAVESCD